MATNKVEMKYLDDLFANFGISPTLKINEMSAKLQSQGKHVYRFGFGQSPFPTPQLIKQALEEASSVNGYTPVAGVPELMDQVKQYYHDRFSVKYTTAVIGSGTKSLIHLLIWAFKGDLFLPVPCWVSYERQAKLVGKKVWKIQTRYEDQWKLTPELLERTFSKMPLNTPKLLILNQPNNPTGQTYSRKELEALVPAFRIYNVIVLADEIYGEMMLDGREFVSLAHEDIYPEGTIVSNGLSKAFGSGGWRMGFMLFPTELKELRKGVLMGISEIFSGVAGPVQMASIRAFQMGDELEQLMVKQNRVISRINAWASETINSSGIRVHPATGSYYLFLDFSDLGLNYETDEDLAEQLLQDTGVALLTGSSFGMDKHTLTARLCLVNFDGGKALENPDMDLEEMCPELLAGIRALVEWVTIVVEIIE